MCYSDSNYAALTIASPAGNGSCANNYLMNTGGSVGGSQSVWNRSCWCYHQGYRDGFNDGRGGGSNGGCCYGRM